MFRDLNRLVLIKPKFRENIKHLPITTQKTLIKNCEIINHHPTISTYTKLKNKILIIHFTSTSKIPNHDNFIQMKTELISGKTTYLQKQGLIEFEENTFYKKLPCTNFEDDKIKDFLLEADQNLNLNDTLIIDPLSGFSTNYNENFHGEIINNYLFDNEDL